MRAIKYLNTTPSTCALYNKGVSEAVYTQDTLTKKIEKKAANYLVVPNNCVLSLSLSLSSTGVNKSLFLSLVRARGTPYNPM